jgi:hypothetical protein
MSKRHGIGHGWGKRSRATEVSIDPVAMGQNWQACTDYRNLVAS